MRACVASVDLTRNSCALWSAVFLGQTDAMRFRGDPKQTRTAATSGSLFCASEAHFASDIESIPERAWLPVADAAIITLPGTNDADYLELIYER